MSSLQMLLPSLEMWYCLFFVPHPTPVSSVLSDVSHTEVQQNHSFNT